MKIQSSNKARLLSLIIGAVGLAVSNQTQAACDYYKSLKCPLYYHCNNAVWEMLDTNNYNQRWACGSGYRDPVYQKSYKCVYVSQINKSIKGQANCGPYEMRPKFTDQLELQPGNGVRERFPILLPPLKFSHPLLNLR